LVEFDEEGFPRRQRGEGVVYEVIHERCAGLDLHKETVVGCVRVSERGEVRHEVRRFATTTAGLLELADWLRQEGCTRGDGSDRGLFRAEQRTDREG